MKKLIILPFALLFLVGCDRGPKMHKVEGKLELTGAKVSALGGSTIEAVSVVDPNVRASGEIKPDGSFQLETLHDGRIRKGAPEGEYKVRVILNDDDNAAKRRAAKALAKRYLKTETANLPLQVPAPGQVTLAVSAQ